jgi:Mrp family chromosome partitioning ATPase
VAFVVVDAPPVLPATAVPMSTGAAEVTLGADGALVVVSASDTHDRELDAAMAHLKEAGGRVLGFVVNRAGRRGPVYRSES